MRENFQCLECGGCRFAIFRINDTIQNIGAPPKFRNHEEERNRNQNPAGHGSSNSSNRQYPQSRFQQNFNSRGDSNMRRNYRPNQRNWNNDQSRGDQTFGQKQPFTAPTYTGNRDATPRNEISLKAQ